MARNFETSLIAISVGSFPHGNASSNRALSYLRGLTELRCKVSLILLAPDKYQSKLSNKRRLDFNNICITYASPLLYPKNALLRKVNFILGNLFGFLILVKRVLFNRNKPILLLLFTNPILLYIYLLFSSLFCIKVFHERTEYPFIGNNTSLMLKFYLKRVVPKFNGIYVISNALVAYFKNFTSNPILLLPMTVELDRFDITRNLSSDRYIAYCGSLYSDKDGVPDLIEAFDLIAIEYPDILLYLIGDNSDVEKFNLVRSKINASRVKERIICSGHVERNKMPELLCNATLLALCRPANIQAQGGFPTKLGEYLATANPVVITDVGDLTKYLEDRKSAFIALPDNPIDFAAKMRECLIDNELASSVGHAGFQVALECFNYKTQAETLKWFVENTI